jgi:hypothetical protein
VIDQIIHILEKKPIHMTGEDIPEELKNPQNLINFQKDRYSILERLKSCNEDTIREWLRSAKKRTDYASRAETELLEKCLKQ